MIDMNRLDEIYYEIADDPENAWAKALGYVPVYTSSERAKIMIVGQAPGRIAQQTMKPWNDVSGVRLRSWLNVTEDQFYNPDIFALVPMDFFYPGKAAHGDLPPRKGFAAKWHPLILQEMPNIKLIIPVGAYAIKYYLPASAKQNLTQTVKEYEKWLPDTFPLVHPSPLNFRWQTRNPWFESELVPVLRTMVSNTMQLQ